MPTADLHVCNRCGTIHPADAHLDEPFDPVAFIATPYPPVDDMSDGQLLEVLRGVREDRQELDELEAEAVQALRARKMPWGIICENLGEAERTIRRRHA